MSMSAHYWEHRVLKLQPIDFFFLVLGSAKVSKSASSQTNRACSMLCGCASNYYIAAIGFK